MSQEVSVEIFVQLAAKISKHRPSSKTTSLQLIDSTTIPLNKILSPWAKFRKTKSGIKLHLNLCYLDKDNQYPESFTILLMQRNTIVITLNVLLIKQKETMSLNVTTFLTKCLIDCITMGISL